MKLSLIVAMDKKFGIGKDNDLLWKLPADMKFFKETSTGHVVITGRKNYESIPEKFRPLPNRENAVLTHQIGYQAPGAHVFFSLTECLEFYKNETERTVFIIGGGQIYAEVMQRNILQEMYITHVDGVFDADTFFPKFSESEWNSETVLKQGIDEKHAFAFEIKKYTRK